MWRLGYWGLSLFALVMAAFTSGCGSSSLPILVKLSPSSSVALDQSQTVGITANVMNDVSVKGVTWTLTGPGSLSNSTPLTVIYNTPTASITSPQQVKVTATSQADQAKSASVEITVNPYPQIPFQSLPNGSVGAAYSQNIELTGGTPPFQWSIYNGPIPTGNYVGGSVPDGLTLNASTGTISGMPTGGGTWYFEGQVTDAAGVTVDNGLLNIQINSSAPPGNPVPFLNQPLTPAAVSPGGNGFTLNVSGTGFVSGAKVDFNNTALATTFVDDQHLTAIVPAADVANAETASVTVVNPAPGGGRSNAVYFQVGVPKAVVNFVNAPNSPLQISVPQAVAAADFNEDGRPDLAIAGTFSVFILLGNGDGTFAPAPGSPIPVPSPPFDDFNSPYAGPLLVGDFNNSGHAGLAVGLFENQAAAILFGNGNGAFTNSGTLANARGMPLMSMAAADFNGDGSLDLLALGAVNGVSPVALLGYGHGAFNVVLQNFEIVGSSLAAGDFNRDGKLDVVTDHESFVTGSAVEEILLGNGDGMFTQGTPLNAKGFVTVGDFNDDGELDLAVCDNVANTLTVFLGDGAGNFTPSDLIGVGNQPQAIITGDFNDDGKLDLAVTNFADNTVILQLGNGDGTFTSGSPLAVGRGPSAIAAADFNGDGKLDLAVANLMDDTVSIFLQP